MSDRAGVGDLYRDVRLRTTELLGGLDDEQWDRPVPACPGWRVRDVLAHLVGVMEDAAAGRIIGPPDDEATAAEVARHAQDGPVDLLATWGELSPEFEAVVSASGMWPAFFDVLSHEHDIRHAIGVPGAHDSDEVRLAAKLLVRSVDVGRPLHVDTGDTVLASRTGEGDPIVLRASAFEVFRFRLGRRSSDQVLALDWSEDPAGLLDALFVFGPAERPIVEA